MRYFLDFEGALFDSEAFRAWPGADAGPFAPGALARFLYPDAAQFLRDKENAATVITFGDPLRQRAKVESAFFGIPRTSVMYTDGVRKGAYLTPHTHLHAGALLVDDTPAELEVLAERCPGLALYEMRRDGRPGDGRWPVVRSLAELP